MHAFSKMILGTLLMVGLAVCSQAQTIHIITVGDFRGFSGGARLGIQKDLGNFTAFFQKSVPAGQLAIHSVGGEMATPAAIRKAIEEVKPEENDTFVFYYTGHAANDSTTYGQYFQLKDEKGLPDPLARTEVRNLMMEKNCRLTVLLTDCCNTFLESGKMGFKLAPNRANVAQVSPLADALFMQAKGIVDITSSKVGQSSYALKDGSIFTVAWVMTTDALTAEAASGKTITWRDVADQLTKKSEVLFRECYPTGAPDGQNSQIPHAYAYPEMPLRLGVTVITQSIGNVRVTGVGANLPGEKAGLKVNDVITHINGVEILDEPEYARAIDHAPQVTSIKFKRNDQEMEVRVELNGEPIPEMAPASATSAPASAPATASAAGSASATLDPQFYGNSQANAQASTQNAPVSTSNTQPQAPAPAANGPVLGVSIQASGNIVAAVIPNSPAAAAGFGVGDQILQFNDRAIRTGADFEAAVDASSPNAEVIVLKNGASSLSRISVTLNKNGGAQSVPAQSAPAQSASPSEPASGQGTSGQGTGQGATAPPVFGVSIQANGNRVVAVTPNSPAADIGIEVNDQILKFNDIEIRNGADFSRAVDLSPKTANLIIRDHRKNQEQSIVIQLNK